MPDIVIFLQDVALLAKQQASVLVEAVLQVHDRRSALVTNYQDAIATYKQSKDSKGYKASKKRLDEGYRKSTEDITTKSKELQRTDSEAAAKVPTAIVSVESSKPSGKHCSDAIVS